MLMAAGTPVGAALDIMAPGGPAGRAGRRGIPTSRV